MIEFAQNSDVFLPVASIKVIGVGGAGGNTVNAMIEKKHDIEFIVANTDAQALMQSNAYHKIQLGSKATKGLGTGADPELGKRAAQESIDVLLNLVQGAHIVFLTGGMGGGTGSGALPVIAQALREKGILTIAVVTKPFLFEGKKRAQVAQQALDTLKNCVDTLLIVPNQKLLELVDASVSMIDAFAMINDVLYQSVKAISDIITKPGHINVDFADVNAIMKNRGIALMGSACIAGQNRAQRAAVEAINSPLLENMSIAGAKGVLLNITGGPNLTLHEINEAASVIYKQVDEQANIIVGSVIDENLDEEIILTVIATGFEQQIHQQNIQVKPQLETELHLKATILDRSENAEQLINPEHDMHKVEGENPVQALPLDSMQMHTSSIDADDVDIPAFMRKKYVTQDKQD